jgi:DNA repair protein RecN (Recombination protein N)
MLKFLSVENFALIDRLEIEFQPGLNLITGETGSGKSILVDAVGLLAGERASQEMVRQGFERARVEGVFVLSARHPARERLESVGVRLDGDEIIVRRELSQTGANKVFVNGTLTTQGFLAELGSLLADIHGQHEQQLLLLPRTQLLFLDAFGANGALVDRVAKLYEDLQKTRGALHELRSHEKERLQRVDTLKFQIADIERLKLAPGLDVSLEQERDLLSSAERRYQRAQEAFQVLYEEENSVLSQLNRVERSLQALVELDPSNQVVASRFQDARYQLEETAYFLRDYAARVRFNPTRLEEILEQLAELQKARRKYGQTVDDILRYYQGICAEIENLSRSESKVADLAGLEGELRREYETAAKTLSEERRRDAAELGRAVERELADLAMENSVFSASVDSSEEWASGQGIDTVEFLISANPGEAPRPLAKIASGGELSRVILALKSVLTLEDYPKTLVFDEIDSGIGGQVASRTGEKLGRLSRQHQVFCVTHLPQIAAHATEHFRVDKAVRQGRTTVQIARLQGARREQEIARMMAGGAVTETTLRHARELLSDAHSRA